MSLTEFQDFEKILFHTTELFNQSNYHFNEFMKLKEQCESMQNYVKSITVKHCLHA